MRVDFTALREICHEWPGKCSSLSRPQSMFQHLILIRKDVDLAHACITVRETKFAKERIIPVSTSVIQALEEYMAIPHTCYDTHYRAAIL